MVHFESSHGSLSEAVIHLFLNEPPLVNPLTINIGHVPGKENVMADYLSRPDMEADLPLTAYAVNSLEGDLLEPVRQQKADPNLRECQLMKSDRYAQPPLQSIPVTPVGDLWSVDVMGPFPRTASGSQYLLVTTEHATRWVDAVPIADHRAKTVTEVVIRHIVACHGIPKMMLTDHGPCFESDEFKTRLKHFGIKRIRTTPYHPQTNRLTERNNRTLKEWDDELRQKVISFLDYQTQLVQSYSSTKPAEEDLKEKDETIDLLKKQLDELQTKEEIMKTDVSTYTYIDTRSVQSQYVSETELLSVKHELNNITIKFNEFNDSKKAELNKYEIELTNRSTQLSILERQLKELKLMNKKLTEDSSILIHSNKNIQSELETIKSELDIKQKQYENNIVSQLYDQVFLCRNSCYDISVN
ncbi:unnamed protein product [Schistosoma curassoni]|uniref:Integrase catalytic domain-containing protein n=1 Tax=Schistosoma curassoni TaxID=6186 RepID=A0A183K422_9TREM|nr:unnamed protein product [Schistosoma curassoni]